MSRGGARNPLVATSTPTPNDSVSSFSSGDTVKATPRSATKSTFRDLLSNSGNNKNVNKPPKEERVFVSGRGGARKNVHKPDTTAAAANAAKIDALIAASSSLNLGNTNPNSADSATVSSFAPSSSAKSKASVRNAIKEVLGGGGNDHGMWKYEPEFRAHYGRGGAYRSPSHSSFHSSVHSGIEILSDGNSSTSSLGIARNANGLFFFGRGRRSTDEEQDHDHPDHDGIGGSHSTFLVVGPGEGIINPTTTTPAHDHQHPFHKVNSAHARTSNTALTRSTMNKSGMSKVSIKVAVKEVLGGGGNDDGEWKYIDVFYPSYGRGGEGARGLFALDEIFNPRRYQAQQQQHAQYLRDRANTIESQLSSSSNPRRSRAESVLSFPSISSDSSSLYGSSSDDGEPLPESPAEMDDVDVDAFLDGYANLAEEPRREVEQRPSVHSDEMVRFRNDLLEARRKRLEAQAQQAQNQVQVNYKEKPALGEGDSIRLTRTRTRDRGSSSASSSRLETESARPLPLPPAPTRSPPPLTSSRPPKLSILPVMPAPPSPPPLPQPSASTSSYPPSSSSYSSSSSLALPLADHLATTPTAVTSPLLPSTTSPTTYLEALAQEEHDALVEEIIRRQRTIEGLTWLIANMPEHEGMEVSLVGGWDGEEGEREA